MNSRSAGGTAPAWITENAWYYVLQVLLWPVLVKEGGQAAVGKLLRAPTVLSRPAQPAASDSSTSPFASGLSTPQEMKRSVRVVGDSS